MRPLHKIGLLLLTVVLLPAIGYIAYEVDSLSTKEVLLSEIYTQQLETILYSVNQHARDVAEAWAGELDHALAEASDVQSAELALSRFLANTPTCLAAFFSDSLFRHVHVESRDDSTARFLRDLDIDPLVLRRMFSNKETAGYRRIEPANLAGAGRRSSVALLFIPDRAPHGAQLVGFVFSPETFIEQHLALKLEEVSREQFVLGVFREGEAVPAYATGPLEREDVRQQRAVWLFPDHILGISGRTVDGLLRQRFYWKMGVISALVVLLLGGVVVVYQNVRREVDLARMKSDFVSNVSHELRTPLSLIRMYVETMEMGRIRDEAQRGEYLKIIAQETERLTRLVNNLLSFSRMEAGKKEYERGPTHLNAVVEEVMAVYRIDLEQQGFSVAQSFEEPLPVIRADTEAVGEALINLVDNAVKYSPDRKAIEVRTGRDGDVVFVEVSDRGVGVAPVERQRIFDKFYRVSGGLVHTTKGTGLGLALVRHIMDAHDGEITVRGRFGGGSTFRLAFPAHHEATPRRAGEPPDPSLPEPRRETEQSKS